MRLGLGLSLGRTGGGGGVALPASNSATARYWALSFRDIDSGQPCCAELSFYDENGDAVAPTGGTAIESSHAPSFVAANAFDSNNTTFWNCGTGVSTGLDTAYVGYDFGTDVTIAGVSYRNRADAYGAGAALRVGSLLYSDDGAAWNVLFNIATSQVYSASGTTVDWIDDTDYTGGHRYWRINVTDTDSSARWSVGGLQLHVGGVTTTDIVTEGREIVTYSNTANLAGFPGSNVLDGDDATRYVTNTTNGTGQFVWDFGPANAPNVTHISIIASTIATEATKDFTLDYSDNGTDWATHTTVTGETAWSSGETRVFPSASGPSGDALLLETGDYLLLETDDFLLLE